MLASKPPWAPRLPKTSDRNETQGESVQSLEQQIAVVITGGEFSSVDGDWPFKRYRDIAATSIAASADASADRIGHFLAQWQRITYQVANACVTHIAGDATVETRPRAAHSPRDFQGLVKSSPFLLQGLTFEERS